MLDTLKRLFKEKKISEIILDQAVLKGYITVEQKSEIMRW